MESPARVAVTTQVPGVFAWREAPDTAHPLAVPSVTVYETFPVPEPPVVPRIRAVPTCPDVVATASVDWPINTIAVTKNAGSFSKVTVTVPSSVATPTGVRPLVVSM